MLGDDRLSVPTQKRRFPILVKVLLIVFVRSIKFLPVIDARYYSRGNFKVRVDAASKPFCE